MSRDDRRRTPPPLRPLTTGHAAEGRRRRATGKHIAPFLGKLGLTVLGAAGLAWVGALVVRGDARFWEWRSEPQLSIESNGRLLEILRRVSGDSLFTSYFVHDLLLNCHELGAIAVHSAHGRDTLSDLLFDVTLLVTNAGGRGIEGLRIPMRGEALKAPHPLIRSPGAEADLLPDGQGPDGAFGWTVVIDHLAARDSALVTVRQRLPLQHSQAPVTFGSITARNVRFDGSARPAVSAVSARRIIQAERHLFGSLATRLLFNLDLHSHDSAELSMIFPGVTTEGTAVPVCTPG